MTPLDAAEGAVAGIAVKHATRVSALTVSALAMMLSGRPAAQAQTSARILLSSGAVVPGHLGFTFGPFYDLAMNSQDQIVFRTTMASPRSEFAAIVRSSGVTFSVVAFQGLLSPVRHETYESFSAPSLNNAGAVTFTAVLKGSGAEGEPASAVIRIQDGSSQVVAAAGDTVPGGPGGAFEEFSAPLIGSAGEVLFAARTSGQTPGSGLFLWTPHGIKPLPLPKELRLGSDDLLEPLFFSHDQAVWVRRGVPLDAANGQLFRAVTVRNTQQTDPPPGSANQTQVLASQKGQAPVQMLMALLEGDNVETAALQGDPSQPVMAVHSLSADSLPVFSFTEIQGQTAGPSSGSVIFAAAPAGQEDDFGIFCFCGGQVTRLTSPEDFSLLAHSLNGKPITSLTGDGAHTVALIAPIGAQAGANAIFVADIQ